MIDLLRNKDESRQWTVPAFKCDVESRVWKLKMEIMVHSIQKEHVNYNMSLLMLE